MPVRPKLMMGAGIAIAGLGLVSAGAGATFTAQVSANTSISTGGVGLSLNGETGSNLTIDVHGQRIGSHFTPIRHDLLLKNTGTLDMASDYFAVKASGCDGGNGAALARALHVSLRDVTNKHEVYDGALCSLASSISGQGFAASPTHAGVGGQLPQPLVAGTSILYQLVIQPNDATQGLPVEAQNANTSVNLVFTGFDF